MGAYRENRDFFEMEKTVKMFDSIEILTADVGLCLLIVVAINNIL